MTHPDARRADLARAQKVLTAALAEFDSACRKLELQYILIAGSLLGAVRHSGFIPWDDDVDVAMRLDDLEAFVENAPAIMKPPYVIHTRKADPILGADAKVYVDGTIAPSSFGEYHDLQRPVHGGLFIDVFILYPVSSHSILKRLERALGWLVYVHPWAPAMAKSRKVSRIRHMRWMVVSAIPTPALKAADAWLRRCARTRDSGHWGIGLGAINGRVTYSSHTLFPPAHAHFQGTPVPVPADSHTALSETFGHDYMTPPSETAQISHARLITFEDL